jgi:hypothetical protein
MKSVRDINSVPRISAAFQGWGSTLLLVRITQQVVDGFVQDIAHQIPFHGIVQPLSPKRIALKPEGQRAWTWLQVHIKSDAPLKLNDNDRLMYNNRKYKVMARMDYTANGYEELEVIEDFQ